ncbi:DEAD/DEAH box helicase [Sporolactobacillus vineae]|uniref:DEAD/DEAH box helicase n=1 Tax=Sporolactobacillus vineae TaxID=444463 RepID=UPI0002895A9F|nr:DEAD/DEAH box helicase [Sporolactobacillus vineae]
MSLIAKKAQALHAWLNEEKPILVVFEGFQRSDLRDEPNKFFSIELGAKINDLMARQNDLVVEAIDKRRQPLEQFSWCTFEEYITVKNFISNFYTVVGLKNNLYDALYPYDQTLTSVYSVYKELYENDDEELTARQQEQLDLISTYYGKIYFNELNQKYYVTYADADRNFAHQELFFDTEGLEPVDYLENPVIDQETYVFELSNSEDSFLSFIDQLKSDKGIEKACAFFADDRSNLPHHYDQRLALLSHLYDGHLHLFLSSKKLARKKITRLPDYLSILKKYWGYDSFRPLKMYKNIDGNGNETIEVSQAQIIDDIVDQASIAMDDPDATPRDIYVTSPTGAGKSIMFQLPALYLAEKYKSQRLMTIVISPLIGLMDDQVKGLERKNISNAKTLNSGISPVEKNEIIQRVQNGEIDILYISTETLLSRSDIEMLIGTRKLGLFVIDEAHIVTTWGKSFRADYWYLGSYLARLRKKQKFPIVTFTATAIYGGPEDMYAETRDSLNMVNPITYFGYVKRDDLMMHVQSSEKDYGKYSNDYRKAKFGLLSKRLKTFTRRKEKTLVYFPTVKLLNYFYSHLKQFEQELAAKTVRYYGPLDNDEKKGNFAAFHRGDAKIMLATKAFGMGIDIKDINNVYHYAPTGNVIDYVQEIGRAARDPAMTGHAYFDFLNKDFTEVKRLYGLSTIRKSEVINVMKKILDIYYTKKSRNLVVSADDFSYIFDKGALSDKNADNRLKIVLLTIEKDFERKMGYSPIVARPRSLFANQTVFLSKQGKQLIEKASYRPFFQLLQTFDTDSYYAGVYQFNMKALWEKKYAHHSFAQFKYLVFKKDPSLRDLKLFDTMDSAVQISVDLKNNDRATVMSEFNQFLQVVEEFLRGQTYAERFFDEKQLGGYLNERLQLSNRYKAEGLAHVFLNGMAHLTVHLNQSNGRYMIVREDQKTRYKVYPNYINYFNRLENAVKKLYTGQSFAREEGKQYTFYRHLTKDDQELEEFLIILGLSESLDLLNYEIQGGNNPQIYIRINSIYSLDRAIHSPKSYNNLIMAEVHKKHRISMAMLNYLFTLPKRPEKGSRQEQTENYTTDFWNIIEDYFLGRLPDKVKYEALAEEQRVGE